MERINQMNTEIPDKFSLDGIAPNMIEVKKLGKALLTIHADGRITVSEDLKPTETAAEVLKIMQDMWLSNQQVVKIQELQERILFLAESPDCNHPRELRAIAFQVRKLEDRIKQLESENDALRADLLLWEEKEAKP